MKVLVTDTHEYDRVALSAANVDGRHALTFLGPRLDATTAVLARGHDAVVPFVNDGLGAAVLRILAAAGVRLVALRCAGHNNLDLAAATTLDAASLARLRPGAILVNTSRGALIDTAALIDRLRNGLLGGVCLDVYEEEAGVFYQDLSNEILEDDALARLLTFPNVLITSHMGFLTREALREIADATIASLTVFEAGKPLYHALALH